MCRGFREFWKAHQENVFKGGESGKFSVYFKLLSIREYQFISDYIHSYIYIYIYTILILVCVHKLNIVRDFSLRPLRREK